MKKDYLISLLSLGENKMKLVVGNQKNYLNKEDAQDFVEKFKSISNKNVIICPSYLYLELFKNLNISIGTQNISKFNSEVVTGEISIEQLKSMNINVSIVGHSERRELMNETIEDTNVKIRNLLENNMIPILCIGETLKEKNEGKTKNIIFSELEGAFKNINTALIKNVIIAYEPIWAIGTGNIPDFSEIDKIIKDIKMFLNSNYSTNNIILYGGSVNSNNVEYLNKIDSIDGYLIGGASTKLNEFINIINRCS